MSRSNRALPLAALLVAIAFAQQPGGAIRDQDAFALYGRAVELMESTAVAVPELARAGAPVTENARQALATLRSLGRQHAGLTYAFLTNVRAYLALADAVEKPYPLPELVGQQFAELRDALDRGDAGFRSLLNQKETQLRNPDRDNLSRYSEADSRLGPPAPGKARVVFLGDSITDFWRLNEYFPDRDFVNRGISGQVTSEMLGRMKADVIDLKPEAVLVLAGTNDLARGVPLKVIEDNLTMIADLAEFHHIRPIFASLLPVSDYHKGENPSYERTKVRPPEMIRGLNEWIAGFCQRRNLVYADYYSQTVDESGSLKADLAADGLHPNGSGYRLMAPVALAAIEKATAPQKGRKRH